MVQTLKLGGVTLLEHWMNIHISVKPRFFYANQTFAKTIFPTEFANANMY